MIGRECGLDLSRLRLDELHDVLDHERLQTVLETLRTQADAVHSANRQFFSADLPKLIFVSPLADGADQIAAEIALRLGFELHAMLPFDRERYRSDMDGSSRRAGAVAGLRTTRAPISVARTLMERGPHVFLSFEGGDRLAREVGLEQVDNSWFVTAERRRQLEELLEKGGFDADVKYGTVGAVAVDSNGHVAAATSTGGLTAKQWGRIGDSPLIGAGTYADDRSAAVSATGSGEYFIRAVAGHQLAERIRLARESLQDALDGTLQDIKELGGLGGLIAVAPTGECAWGFTTRAMYRGVADSERRAVAIYADEELTCR